MTVSAMGVGAKRLAAVLLAAATVLLLSSAAASAHTKRRVKALRWAETQAGAPYVYGGTGPYGSGYDCSGLVYKAYLRATGINIGRTTGDMLASRRLVRTNAPRRGDLAFFGSGHVELVYRWKYDWTFGAHDAGSVVGPIHWQYPYWYPTAYYRLRY